MRLFSLKTAALFALAVVPIFASTHSNAACDNKAVHEDDNISPLPLVLFDTAKATLKYSSTLQLAKALDMMDSNPDKVMCLIGRADERGNPDYNLSLSKKRAESVQQFLRNCSKNYNYKFEIYAAGKDNPMFKGSGHKVWRKNRSVAVSLVDSPSDCKPD